MTPEQRQDVKRCIRFYEKNGWDWSNVVEYLVCRYNGTWQSSYQKSKEN